MYGHGVSHAGKKYGDQGGCLLGRQSGEVSSTFVVCMLDHRMTAVMIVTKLVYCNTNTTIVIVGAVVVGIRIFVMTTVVAVAVATLDDSQLELPKCLGCCQAASIMAMCNCAITA